MKNSARKVKQFRPGELLRITAGLLLCVAIVVATVIGCSWPGTSQSVRFNAYQTEREMGRLPPLPTLANGMNELRAHWEMEDYDGTTDNDYTLGEKRTKEVSSLWERAEAVEKDGNLALDRELLKEYLQRTDRPRDIWFSPSGDRNSAIDRLDALSALDRGASAAKVRAYLDARHAHDSEKPVAEEIEDALDIPQSDANLKDNVAYLKAAELYRQASFAEASEAFAALGRKYPHSEKREAALFMAAVATMKTSALYIPASGNSDYTDEPADTSTDQAWHDAFAAFEKAIREYPRGRYFKEARGWLAYLMLRSHDRAGALAEYYRLLADKNEHARVDAAFSLTLVRSSATDDEMSRVEKQLANEPEAALAYAYHNIYNYSIDPGESYPPYNSERIQDGNGQIDYEAEERRAEYSEKEWRQTRAATIRGELIRTLNFSKNLMARYPKLAIGGAFALRAAQASEELEDDEAAATFARRALSSRLNGEERAQALWTLGIAEHRRRQFEPARQCFTTLLREYPTSRLTEGARRTLAMIAEDAGDIDGALEQYIALDYSIDVAYFIDVLMTTDQLSSFIEKHPTSTRKDELTYALGLRYLRANRWDDARQTLAGLKPQAVPNGSAYLIGSNCNGAADLNCMDPKDGDTNDEGERIITPRLLMRDIQTANDLEALERTVDRAEGDEAKAEALYQYASYQYQASTLLFYNPIAWGGRYWSLSELAAQGGYRLTNESQILFAYMQEHETPARALKIYLDVVSQYPRTRAARDSLYTAAVCHERLSNYNPYWREIYQNGLHAGERMVTYRDVKAAYPNYQLPRGTYGWQPSTRTVNGGPGWQAPPKAPKPLPRLTKRERLKIFGNSLVESVTSFWNERGRRWLTQCVIVLGLLFIARVAARNRRRLRARMARHRIEHSRQTVTYPWLDLFWIDHVEPSRREQIGKFLGEKRQEFLELSRDRRSRPVLLRSLVSHTALSGLALALIWTVWL